MASRKRLQARSTSDKHSGGIIVARRGPVSMPAQRSLTRVRLNECRSPRASRSDHSLHYAGSSVEWIDGTIRLEQPKLSHVVFRLSQGQRKPNGDVDRAASIAD